MLSPPPPPHNSSLFLTSSFYPGCAVAAESPASLGLAAVASISVLLRPAPAALHQLMMGELPPVDCYVSDLYLNKYLIPKSSRFKYSHIKFD